MPTQPPRNGCNQFRRTRAAGAGGTSGAQALVCVVMPAPSEGTGNAGHTSPKREENWTTRGDALTVWIVGPAVRIWPHGDLSHVFAGQKVGVVRVGERIWLVRHAPTRTECSCDDLAAIRR